MVDDEFGNGEGTKEHGGSGKGSLTNATQKSKLNLQGE